MMTFYQLIANPEYQHKYVLERIIGHIMDWTREELILHYDDAIDETILNNIHAKYHLYTEKQYPLEYILGYVEYGGLRLNVSESVIIPRPETEYMIESVREYITEGRVKSKEGRVENKEDLTLDAGDLRPVTILVDVGTGSGVLGLSILHSHGQQIDQAMLIDVSDDALEVARGNYERLVQEGKIDKEVRVTIVKGHLLDVVFSGEEGSENMLNVSDSSDVQIIITANLPYIPDEDFDSNPDRTIKHEPRVAFVGGDDGLDLYREMFQQIMNYKLGISNGGNTADTRYSPFIIHHGITMFLEMMTWQVDILRQEFEWLVFEEIKTFHANIRIVKVMFKS